MDPTYLYIAKLLQIIFYICIVFIFVPVLVYLCVKFGTFAFYKAKQLINKEKEN